jgi:broad specificity polyphosphatase/5'/3'-nucleotidase SurE
MKKGGRPPKEGEIGDELFKFVRNVLVHFPYFESWNDVWISKEIVNWNKEKKSIDKFLKMNKGCEQIKYRIWEELQNKLTYLNINFPKSYSSKDKIYLKEIITEKEGVKFSYILMKDILASQIKEISSK